MTQNEVINNAVAALVVEAPSGIWYLEPTYRMTIRAQGWGEVVPEDELAEILLLTVDKRNARGNKSQAVLDTLFQLMNDAGPALTEEETKLIDDFLQYRIKQGEIDAILKQ